MKDLEWGPFFIGSLLSDTFAFWLFRSLDVVDRFWFFYSSFRKTIPEGKDGELCSVSYIQSGQQAADLIFDGHFR